MGPKGAKHFAEMLKVNKKKRLVFDDFQGSTVMMGGHIADGTNINVSLYEKSGTISISSKPESHKKEPEKETKKGEERR